MEYDEVGLKCGLEIHQQLEGSKLFCNSPCTITKRDPDFTVSRRLRASKGETGSADQAAEYEMEKGKEFVYQGYDDITGLVELDEAPPRPINDDALTTVLEFCKLVHADIVDQIHVMRKIVVDGSNPSGFQRTALVGRNGYIVVDGERISIESICLEEEACQIIERSDERDVYNLSRQGIPLIEVATGPDISSPEQCKAVAARLGMMLRSTGRVKRGIGSIRQDVNLSIDDGARVEIKGFQELDSIPDVIEYEVERQLEQDRVEPHVRRAEDDNTTSYLRPMPGAARMYPETDLPKLVPDTDVEAPTLLTERAENYQEEYDLPEGFGKQLVEADVAFDAITDRFDLDRTFLAEFFTSIPKDIKSREGVEVDPSEHLGVLERVEAGDVPQSAVQQILTRLGRGESVDYSEYERVSDAELRSFIEAVLEDEPDAPMGAVMGQVMREFDGQVEGSRAKELVQELQD